MFIITFQNQCSIPPAHSEAVAGHKLVSFSIVTRNGLNSPSKVLVKNDDTGTWFCDGPDSISPRISIGQHDGESRRILRSINRKMAEFPPNCGESTLTLTGMHEMKRLGEHYRRYLVDEMRYLSVYINDTSIYARSANNDASIRSLHSFMNGLYPTISPGEQFEFISGSYNDDPLILKYDQDFLMSAAYIDRKAQHNADYNNYFTAVEVAPEETDWLLVGEIAGAYECSNQMIPDYLRRISEQSQKDLAFARFYASNSSNLFFDILFDQIDHHKPRFSIYSSDDFLLSSILSHLKYTEENVPPFASHIDIELWEQKGKQKLRFVYNGMPIPLADFGGETLVSYTEFKLKSI